MHPIKTNRSVLTRDGPVRPLIRSLGSRGSFNATARSLNIRYA
jgi:hypothetical protein